MLTEHSLHVFEHGVEHSAGLSFLCHHPTNLPIATQSLRKPPVMLMSPMLKRQKQDSKFKATLGWITSHYLKNINKQINRPDVWKIMLKCREQWTHRRRDSGSLPQPPTAGLQASPCPAPRQEFLTVISNNHLILF